MLKYLNNGDFSSQYSYSFYLYGIINNPVEPELIVSNRFRLYSLDFVTSDVLWQSINIPNANSYLGAGDDAFLATSSGYICACSAGYAIPSVVYLVKTDQQGQFVPNDDQVEPILTRNSIRNYPNPFRTSTTIVYQTSTKGYNKIEIFNIRGQKIKTLSGQLQEKGEYSLIWNGTDQKGQHVSSGIYFLRFTQNNMPIITLKMMFVQ